VILRRRFIAVCLLISLAGCTGKLIEDSGNDADFDIEVPPLPTCLISDAGEGHQPEIHATIHNASRQQLLFSLPAKSCNCFDVRLPTQPLAIGESADVTILAPNAAGVHHMTFMVCARGVARGRLEKPAEVTLQVFPEGHVTPTAVVQRVDGNRPFSFDLSVRIHTHSKGDAQAHRIRVEGLPTFMSVQSLRSAGREQLTPEVAALDWKLSIGCSGDLIFGPSGNTNGRLMILCDSVRLFVPYHFSDAREIVVAPEVLFFDAIPVGTSATRSAIIYANADSPLIIKAFEAQKHEDFTVASIESLAAAEPGGPRRFRVTIRFSPSKRGAQRTDLSTPFSTAAGKTVRLSATGTGLL
jgi:hypothetical protein